ncbi:MAG: geranylgeranyl reductase family protein [Candidatus Lokiarchaeota archaeon]|nr:geranylgeranyl reductase family protein [Candidatus Lokiarchaeota archaeon]MBD3200132.1 geranylgeranyl reductase family protein [Candidatus Lokiarchaeota archaeon]
MDSIEKKFDVIVIGAGSGGTMAACFGAKNGLDVCLVERKPKHLKPEKICGDAVGDEIFDFLKIPAPQGDELANNIKGAKLFAPDRTSSITMIDPKQTGYIVDRLKFGQRLLKEALDAGVKQFLDETIALDLLYKEKRVSGVKVRLKDGEKTELTSKIVIDASGLYSPLRKKIKSDLIEKDISKKDMILCYREIINFPARDEEIMDKDYITIILDQEKAPGGYIWYFPKGNHSINLGLGGYMHYKGKIKDFYRKNVFNEFVNSTNIEIVSSGGGVAPVRRPLWSCADDGIMFVGDSALQVNPLHGGGIDPSMRAGFYAALTAAGAIESGDYSIDKLWDYNHKVMTNFGAEFASLDLLRRVLQNMSNEDLNFGLKKNLLTASEILEISGTGGINLSLMDIASKAFSGIKRPNLLLDLNYLRLRMNEIADIYRKFPMDISKFEAWKKEVKTVYSKLKRMVIDIKN